MLAGAVLAATGFATTAILPAAAGRLAADTTPFGFGAFVLLPVWMVAAGVVLLRRETARLAI